MGKKALEIIGQKISTIHDDDYFYMNLSFLNTKFN